MGARAAATPPESPLYVRPSGAGNHFTRAQPGSLAGARERVRALLELAGAPLPPTHGRSLLGPLRGGENGCRGLIYGSFRRSVVCTDGEWTLMGAQRPTARLHLYSSMIYRSLVTDSVRVPVDSGAFVPGVTLPRWRIPVNGPGGGPNLLYHTAADPARMLALMEGLLREEGVPEELFTRLELTAGG